MLFRSTGYIVTNAHVVKGANTVRVITYGGQEYLGKVIDQAVDMDIALVKLDFDNLPVARLGSVLDLKAGTELFALGAPLGFDFTITRGLLSSVSRKVQGREYIQSDLPLNPGNSGGPLFNNRGEVVGVNTLVVKDAQGISLSIPIPAVMDYLDSRGIAYSASLSTNSIRPTSVESHNVHDRGFKYIYVVLPLLVVASGLGIALLIKKKRNPRDKDFNIELK